MTARRGVAEMVGEGLRECAVLILVFGMLDKFVVSDGPSPVWTATVLATALSCYIVGAAMERKRIQ